MKINLLIFFLGISRITYAQTIIAKFNVNDSCVGQLVCFNNSSTSKNGLIKSWQWDFGDGNYAYIKNPCHKFQTSGSFNIKLLITDFIGEKDSITKSIYVHNQTKLSLISNSLIQCYENNSFDFLNTTKDTGKIHFHWDLGDNTFSNSNLISGKNYPNSGNYKLKLISLNQYNCLDTLVKIIQVIANPKPDFGWKDVCNPSQFDYNGSLPISKFIWNFNNESISTLQNPTNDFKTLGIKNIKLIVHSKEGCIDSITKTCEIKKQATAGFVAYDNCEKDSTSFINKSKNADSLIWRFGDGSTSTENNPKHLYDIKGISQTFGVTLLAFIKGGCPDSISGLISVNALPISDFSWTQYTGGLYSFYSKQKGNTYYRWLFGDGDSSNSPIINHRYSFLSDNYNVCLKIINPIGCISETCKSISLGVKTLHDMYNTKIYPIPAMESLTLETELSLPLQIRVYNMLGEVVLMKLLNAAKETIDVRTLVKGVYTLEIIERDKISRSIFIKH